MRKKRCIFLTLIIVALTIAVPIMAVMRNKKSAVAEIEMQHIIIWQIDGFEGGRGSRAQYLQNMAQKCFGDEKIYVSVTTLTADAARENLSRGETPDLLSYSAGFYGAEKYINSGDFFYKTWCRGGYCLLTLEANCDFSDVKAENTVVNRGKDNLSAVNAALCGVYGAAVEEPTNAYLKLIGGKYKYLLGTQRDVFRLKARNVGFAVKPLTQFNDLFQNISVITSDSKKYESCTRYINYLLSSGDAGSLGLMDGGGKLCAEELNVFQGLAFGFVINGLCGKDYLTNLNEAAKIGDINKIKSLLK